MAKKFDPKAKAKRDKVVAAGAGVVLLGVLAISVPMTMKMMKSQNGASSSASSTTATTAAPSPGAPSTPSAAVPADLVSATVAPAPGLSQLGSLDRFDGKDPFVQQISPNAGGGVPVAVPVPTGRTAPRGGRSTRDASPAPAPDGASTSSSPSGSTTTTAVPPTSAVISVNGGPAQQVALDQDFPLPPFDPLFHLVSLTKNAAKIAIVGGSYASGAPTATLRKGRPLTLMNTADGTRYVLRLLWVGAGAPPTGLLPPPAAPATP